MSLATFETQLAHAKDPLVFAKVLLEKVACLQLKQLKLDSRQHQHVALIAILVIKGHRFCHV